jgi:chorismate synthase
MALQERKTNMTFTFGIAFRIHIYGESHGRGIGVILDGCPPGLEIDVERLQSDLDNRKPGRGRLSSTRRESDRVSILSGLFCGKTTQAPLAMMIPNTDVDSSSYDEMKDTPRPGTADYTARVKYGGKNDHRGGGTFSGRMTAALVAAGSVAKQLLGKHGIEILAHVIQIGKVRVRKEITNQEIKSQVYANELRCADSKTAALMESEIINARRAGDSVGGIIECRILGVPVGIGEPFFDSVESIMSHAMFAIPGIKAIEFGAGFSSAEMFGSDSNDPFGMKKGEVVLLKNDAGGILGGISNGQPIVFRVAVKPTPSIAKPQQTIDLESGETTVIRIRGRHDPCIAPRAVSVVEGVAAIAIADLVQRNGRQMTSNRGVSSPPDSS